MDWKSRYLAAAAAAAQYFNVPLDWVQGVIGAESSYDAPQMTWEAAVGEYSYGPMQVLGSTARWLGFNGDPQELMVPETGIYWGTAYLRNLIDRYGQDYPSVISAYNEGHADSVAGAGYIARVTDWLNRMSTAVALVAADAVDAVSASEDPGALLAIGALAALAYFGARGSSARRRR